MNIPVRPRWWWAVLYLGLVVWLLFVGIDALRRVNTINGEFPLLEYWRFNVDADRGFAEFAGYSFMLVGAVALIVAWRWAADRLAYLALALIMLTIIADDSLEIHEQGGAVIATALGWESHFHLRAQDFGELAVFALIGIPLLVLLTVTWRFSSPRTRRSSRTVIICLGVMVFFAAGVDMLGPASGPAGLDWHYRARYLLKLVEFSGEFLSMVAVCLAALRIAASTGSEDGTIRASSPVTIPAASPST